MKVSNLAYGEHMKAIFYKTAALALLCTSALTANASSTYTLDDFADHSGNGPNLVPHGGTLSGGIYSFGTNQGLSLDWSGFNATSYAIDIRFSFNTVGGSWLKILDFAHLSLDEGLYVYGDHLQFVEQPGTSFINGPSGAFQNDQFADLTITRDGATKRFTGSLNGVQQFSFIDSTDQAVFAGPNPLATFFIDDRATGGGEATGGRVDFITVSSVPLPASAILWLSGLVFLRGSRQGRKV
jgi:hypothetical protein